MYRFSRKERTFLEHQRVGRIALAGSGGSLRVTPVCHVFSKGLLYIETGKHSWKTRTLERHNQVAFVVDEYTEIWANQAGIQLRGTVEVLHDGTEFISAKRMLFRKYPQFKEFWEEGAHVVLKLTPNQATTWGL